ESLPPGTAYPPITVIVNVATNAPNNLTNIAKVSGGGESNISNDTAADPTTVMDLAPIQAWRLNWFGTTADTGAAADTAINTSDGMPNLLKYALNLTPLVPTANPITGDISTGFLRLTAPKNPSATDITMAVQVAESLASQWTTNNTSVDQNTSTILQVHD